MGIGRSLISCTAIQELLMELASAIAGWRGDMVKMLVGESLQSGQLISLGI